MRAQESLERSKYRSLLFTVQVWGVWEESHATGSGRRSYQSHRMGEISQSEEARERMLCERTEPVDVPENDWQFFR